CGASRGSSARAERLQTQDRARRGAPRDRTRGDGSARVTTVITGAALPRQDGPVKVTGAARYANDHHAEQMLYGVLVGAPVPAGRLRAIDTTAAATVPGVVRVLTHADFPRLSPAPVPPYSSERLPLQDPDI